MIHLPLRFSANLLDAIDRRHGLRAVIVNRHAKRVVFAEVDRVADQDHRAGLRQLHEQ